MRRIIFLFIVFTSCLIFISCGNVEKETNRIEIYTHYDTQKNELSNSVDTISANATVYVFIQTVERFGRNSVSINISRFDKDQKVNIYGASIIVNPADKRVVMPLELTEAGAYEISFFFDNPDDPMLTKKFIVE